MQKKKTYKKPELKKVAIDNEISLAMASFGPGGDPESSFIKRVNPLKWWR